MVSVSYIVTIMVRKKIMKPEKSCIRKMVEKIVKLRQGRCKYEIKLRQRLRKYD